MAPATDDPSWAVASRASARVGEVAVYRRRRRARAGPTSNQGKRLFGLDAATSKATDGLSVESSSGAASDIATSRNEYDPDGVPKGTRSRTITCSAALAAKSRTDSPMTDSHSDFAGSSGFGSSRPRRLCAVLFVTVNGTWPAPDPSSVTFWVAAVIVKLGKVDEPPIRGNLRLDDDGHRVFSPATAT
jgi:hypothetical protein